MGVTAPLIGDFHYIGHKLLSDHPACAEALDKYRINPGNVGFKNKRDLQFGRIIEIAIRNGKAVRIGANWGSLDQELLTRLMDENARSEAPLDARAVTREAMVRSALLSAARAEEIGLSRARIILSAKVSAVQDLITVYRMLGERSDYALHLGLTEAGMGSKGVVASSAALGVLLQEGLGDTIRISLTPEPGGDRTQEVRVAQELLQAMGFRSFAPQVAACPGCGRTTSTVFQELARDIETYLAQSMPQWRAAYPGRRAAQRCGDGLHRERAGREQARRHRHLVARNGRGAGRAGVRRRRQDRHASRAAHRRGFQGAGRGLYHETLCAGPPGGGVAATRTNGRPASMYEPPLHRVEDLAELHALIRARVFGLLISNGSEGLIANSVPFVLDPDGFAAWRAQGPCRARQPSVARSSREAGRARRVPGP